MLVETTTKGSDIITHNIGATYPLIMEACMINSILALSSRIEEYYEFCLPSKITLVWALTVKGYIYFQAVARSHHFLEGGKEKFRQNLLNKTK